MKKADTGKSNESNYTLDFPGRRFQGGGHAGPESLSSRNAPGGNAPDFCHDDTKTLFLKKFTIL